MKSFFVDLGNTYLKSSLTQKKALLSSIFNSKLSWSYPGFSNLQISPIYQSIQHFEEQSITLGAPRETRTPTPFLALTSEASLSTNSSIGALPLILTIVVYNIH